MSQDCSFVIGGLSSSVISSSSVCGLARPRSREAVGRSVSLLCAFAQNCGPWACKLPNFAKAQRETSENEQLRESARMRDLLEKGFPRFVGSERGLQQ